MGQEHTVKVHVPPVPWTDEVKAEIVARFHETHEHFYTYRLPDTPTEIVNLHLVAYGRLQKPELHRIDPQRGPVSGAVKETRPVYFTDEGWQDTPIYDREKLGAGAAVSRPGDRRGGHRLDRRLPRAVPHGGRLRQPDH